MANADIDRLTTVLYHTSLNHLDKDVLIDRYFQILTEITINLGDILNNYDDDKIKYDRREDIDNQIRNKYIPTSETIQKLAVKFTNFKLINYFFHVIRNRRLKGGRNTTGGLIESERVIILKKI